MPPVRDEFESITESTPLIDEIRGLIAATGPITFRDFMQMALYHPLHGYYATQEAPTSRGGDYVTSPEVHSIFGALVGKQLAEMWRALGEPPRFDVVEQGAGAGLLARDILHRTRQHDPSFTEALRYSIVEPLPHLRGIQRRTLAGESADAVRWSDDFPGAVTGCILSNELVDAFPVHRVTRVDNDLVELYVDYRDGRFVDAPGAPSTPKLREYFDALGLLPGENAVAEVRLDADGWMRDIAQTLQRGYVLTFDYGYEAADLFAPWRRDGTLLTFYNQSAGSDPYARIGKQDITASVDFTSLQRAGEDAGLQTIALTDQASFLVRLGLTEAIAAVASDRPAEMEEYFARRQVVMSLLDPAGLGRIKVLLQGKGVPEASLVGFTGDV